MHRERLILGCILLIAAGLAVAANEINTPARQPLAALTAAERVIVKLRTIAPAGTAQAKAMADAMSALTTRTSLVMKSAQPITANMQVLEFKPQASGEIAKEGEFWTMNFGGDPDE